MNTVFSFLFLGGNFTVNGAVVKNRACGTKEKDLRSSHRFDDHRHGSESVCTRAKPDETHEKDVGKRVLTECLTDFLTKRR